MKYPLSKLFRLVRLTACILVLFSSCNKSDSVSSTQGSDHPGIDSLVSMDAPASFNYETFREVALDVTLLAPDNTPIANVPVSFLNKSKEMGGTVLYKSLTDENGKISGTLKIAISRVEVNPIDVPVDTDHDGVNDVYDDFPTDPTRAYLNYYPSAATMGTVAFEDYWPFSGDYDMNDLVVDYRYAVVSNAINKVVEMKAKYGLKAAGASYKNGFGIEFPFAPSLVSSVTGSLVSSNHVVTLGSNGCETGQSKAVIIPFDDAAAAMNTTGLFNTYTGGQYFTRDTISMNIGFTRALTQTELGTAPFNPFIIINGVRGREAHLAGYTYQQSGYKIF
ncbi:MAG: LruC protein [Ferruginibacter sp.]|nr:LruC protein [Ferruginibacter sp.]